MDRSASDGPTRTLEKMAAHWRGHWEPGIRGPRLKKSVTRFEFLGTEAVLVRMIPCPMKIF